MTDELGDDPYFEPSHARRAFDSGLVQEPLSVIPVREALVLSTEATVTEAMRAVFAEFIVGSALGALGQARDP